MRIVYKSDPIDVQFYFLMRKWRVGYMLYSLANSVRDTCTPVLVIESRNYSVFLELHYSDIVICCFLFRMYFDTDS